MRMFGKKVLRRILGPKRDKGSGVCRKLCNEELHKVNTSPNIIMFK
jgi:hypothetical protein